MDLTPSKKLPHFSEYIAYELAESKKWKRTAWTGPIAGGSLLILALAAALFGRIAGPGAFLWLWVPVTVTWGLGMAALDSWLKKPRSSDERYLLELDSIVMRYAQSMNFRRLHRDLDYTAAQLLEASAFYWSKVKLQLSSPAWNSDTTPLHLRSVRQQALQAIDEAMREQMTLCLRCLSLPGQKKSTDLRDVIEDALGIDVDKILDSIRSNPVLKKGVQSDRLPEIFEPARALAERLKLLSSEIDKMTLENMQKFQGQGSGANASLDAAIRGLHEIQVAEGELSDDQVLRERL